MIKTEKYIYQIDGTNYEGYLSWDNEISGKRPVVLIAPTFRGQSGFEIVKAEELAGLGYLGFAIDLYGQGRRASTPEVATMLMNELNHNRPLLSARFLRVLELIKDHDLADTSNIGAIGFCFGGKCVLDLARTGTKIKGVVSFHGIYDAPDYLESTPIKASVLVLHGWDDPLAPPTSLVALGDELTRKGSEWQILAFGHTGHAFTNPNAKDKEGGMEASGNGTYATATDWKKSIKKHAVECLVCGQVFKQLSARHLSHHDLDPRSYRERFGIPMSQPLSAKATTAARRAVVQQIRPWEKAPTYIKSQEPEVTPEPKAAAAPKRAGRKKAATQ